MATYKTEKEVIELMKNGFHLETKTNYNGSKIMSYWLGKRGEIEHSVKIKTRESLLKKGLIDENNDLPRHKQLTTI